jgi:PHD/YefM family antitoxin component YafN of YafNO toxin-antitoxin module
VPFFGATDSRSATCRKLLDLLDTFKGAIITIRDHHVRSQKRHSGYDDISPQSGEIPETSEKDEKPLILAVNGKAEAVVQDAEAYQRLLDMAAQADASEGIRQGLEDVKKGRVRPARSALETFRRPCHTSLGYTERALRDMEAI